MFRDLRYVGDIMAGGYNAATLEGVAEYMRASGSKRARHEGELLRADGIQACAGMLRRMREVSTRCEVVGPSMMLTASLGFKGMRKAEPAAGERDTRRAFRAAYFVLLAAAGWDRVSVMGEEAWAMALTAHNAILRGGEVGRRDGYAFDPQVGLTLRSVRARLEPDARMYSATPSSVAALYPPAIMSPTYRRSRNNGHRPVAST